MRSRPSRPTTRYSSSIGFPSWQLRDGRPPTLAIFGVHERLPQTVVLRATGERPADQRLAVGPAVDGPVAAVGVDLERVEVAVHRLHDARQRRVRLVELGTHAPPLRDVGHDAADLDRTVPRRRVAARSCTQRVIPSAPISRYSTSLSSPSASASLKASYAARSSRMQGRFPVLHLGVGRGATQQTVRPGPLEQLLETSVGMGQRQVHVLAGDVEQAREPRAHLGDASVGLLALGDVGDDAVDDHAAVDPATRPGAVPQNPGDPVEAEQPVGDLCVIAAEQPAVELLVGVPVLGVDARLPEVPDVDAGGPPATDEALGHRLVGRVMDIVTGHRDLARVHELLEQIEDAREAGFARGGGCGCDLPDKQRAARTPRAAGPAGGRVRQGEVERSRRLSWISAAGPATRAPAAHPHRGPGLSVRASDCSSPRA